MAQLVVKVSLPHVDLRPGDAGQVVGGICWVEDGRRREVWIGQFGGRRVGLWSHECKVEEPTGQLRLEI
jgi:hypothetical protein